jgi:hypothetical protein
VPKIAERNSSFVFPKIPKIFVELAVFMDNEMLKYFQKTFGETRAEEQMMRFASAFLYEVNKYISVFIFGIVISGQTTVYPEQPRSRRGNHRYPFGDIPHTAARIGGREAPQRDVY